MMSKTRIKTGNNRGQSLIEFALILPIALFLILGFFDLGRAIFYYSSLTNAVREAARSMIVEGNHDNEEAIRTAIEDELETFAFAINPADIVFGFTYFTENDDMRTPTPSVPPSATNPITNIVISASYSYVPVTPFISRLLNNGSITLVTHSTMRISSFYRPPFE